MGLTRGINDMQPFEHELQFRTQLRDGDVIAVHVDPLDLGFKGFDPLRCWAIPASQTGHAPL